MYGDGSLPRRMGPSGGFLRNLRIFGGPCRKGAPEAVADTNMFVFAFYRVKERTPGSRVARSRGDRQLGVGASSAEGGRAELVVGESDACRHVT